MKRVKRIPAAVLFAAASFIGCQQAFANVESPPPTPVVHARRTANTTTTWEYQQLIRACLSVHAWSFAISGLAAALQFVSTTVGPSLRGGLSICRQAPRTRSAWMGSPPSASKLRATAAGRRVSGTTSFMSLCKRRTRRRRIKWFMWPIITLAAPPGCTMPIMAGAITRIGPSITRASATPPTKKRSKTQCGGAHISAPRIFPRCRACGVQVFP